MRKRVRDALWKISDRLCSRRLTSGAGHWIGELGWLLREDGARHNRDSRIARLSEDGSHG